MKNDCIFCKIARGEIPCEKIWEDSEFLAILDIMPNTEGMTLVLPKKHFNSDVFQMPDEAYLEMMKAVKKVAKILEKGLNVKRVALVIEGMGVNHMHVKLYPLHGLKEKFTEMWYPKEIYFDKYGGYLTTQVGPKKSIEDLKKIELKPNYFTEYLESTKRAFNIIGNLIDGYEESDLVTAPLVYPIILRLRGLYLAESLLKNKKYKTSKIKSDL